MKKALPFGVIALVIIIVGFFVPVILPTISVSAEHLFDLGPLNVTNALLTSWVVTLLILLFFFLASRDMQALPSGLQNFVELLCVRPSRLDRPSGASELCRRNHLHRTRNLLRLADRNDSSADIAKRSHGVAEP